MINWIKNYIFWELELLKVLGYDLKFENLVDKKIIENQTQYIFQNQLLIKKLVPNFLIDKTSDTENISNIFT